MAGLAAHLVKGKTALIIDDEVSTAGTLVQAVDVLKQNGAEAVYAAFTHGVYVGPAIERIEKEPHRRGRRHQHLPLQGPIQL